MATNPVPDWRRSTRKRKFVGIYGPFSSSEIFNEESNGTVKNKRVKYETLLTLVGSHKERKHKDMIVCSHLIGKLKSGHWLCSDTMQGFKTNIESSSSFNCFYELGQVQQFARDRHTPIGHLQVTPPTPNAWRVQGGNEKCGFKVWNQNYLVTYLNLAEPNLQYMHVKLGDRLLLVFSVWYINDLRPYSERWQQRFIFENVAFPTKPQNQGLTPPSSSSSSSSSEKDIHLTLTQFKKHIVFNPPGDEDDDSSSNNAGILELIKKMLMERNRPYSMLQLKIIIRVHYGGYVNMYYHGDLPTCLYLPHQQWSANGILPNERPPRTVMDDQRQVIRNMTALRLGTSSQNTVAKMPLYVYEMLMQYVAPAFHAYYMENKYIASDMRSDE